MDVKAEIKELGEMLEKRGKDANRLLVASKLMGLIAVLQDEQQEIPADVLEPLTHEGRRVVLMAWGSVMLQSMTQP